MPDSIDSDESGSGLETIDQSTPWEPSRFYHGYETRINSDGCLELRPMEDDPNQ